MKWNESGFRPPLCTYRLKWARKTSWWRWDDLDDTVLQTQDSNFVSWRSEAEHATSRSRRLPTILTFTRGWRRNIFCFLQAAGTGNRTPNSGVKGSGANHYPRAPAQWHISNLNGTMALVHVLHLCKAKMQRTVYISSKQLPPFVFTRHNLGLAGIDSHVRLPSKCKTPNQCWTYVGPSSTTLAQHKSNIGSASWAYVLLWHGGRMSMMSQYL